MTTRRLLTLALAAGTLAALLPAHAEPLVEMGSYAHLTRVGDLDGDGTDDLVDYRVSGDVEPQATGRQVTVTAHRGVDGRVLWQHVPLRGGVTSVRGVRLASGPGVLLVGDDDIGTFGTGGSTLVGGSILTALTRTGTVAWTSSLAGISQRAGGSPSVTATLLAQPYVAAIGQFAPGAPDDVVVGVVDEVRTSARTVSRLTAVVVDGATGASRTALTVTDEAAGLRLSGLPDLDRDGLGDLAVAHRSGAGTTVSAHSAKDARELWRSPALGIGDGVLTVSAGDTDGDRVPDVLVSPADELVEFQYAAPRPGEHSLLDGRTGALRWSREVQSAVPLGDVGRDGRADVVLLDRGDPTEATVVATALDGRARVLWQVARSLPRSESERSLPVASIAIAGDVDTDGVLDVAYRLVVEPLGGKPRVDTGVVSGRTGRRTPTPGAAAESSHSAVDGRGSDAVGVARSGDQLVTTVTSGDTGALLWRTSVRLPAGFAAESVETVLSARLGRDRCGDVVVSSTDGKRAVAVAFSGADGVPVWSLTRRGADPVVVARPAPVSRTDRNPCR